jgi:TM2 domain-containing membrane protein YozV
MQSKHDSFVAYVLWIFGFFGLHRFYCGRKLTGAIWALTLGLLGVGWLIDLLLIPGMVQQANLRYTQPKKDVTVAWLLLAFLGLLGVHRFYLGKIGTGVLWLFTGGLFGIGVIYDLFTLNEQLEQA